MSYVTSYFHIVFSTHKRTPSITPSHRADLYRVLAARIKNLKCKALIINGTEDHVHILLTLHPDIALSTLMRDIKSQSSVWMKKSGLFPHFDGWEREYGAFCVSASHKNAVYEYIDIQEEHHKTCLLNLEMRRLAERNGLRWYEPGE